MIDFHTHILPGIDDGSRDIDMTEKMLRMEQSMGVSHIYATPHFYAHRRSIDYFLERRNRALEKTRELLAKDPELPQITAGAEVYYFSGMGKAKQLDELCVEGTDILLLELPFAQWHSDVIRDIEDIMHKRGLRVVLAHLERYEAFQKDRHVWDCILDMPLTIQLNCEDIIDAGSFFRRNHMHKTSMELLSRYDEVIIGSDCHNLTDRKPNLADARAAIKKRCGAERLAQIDEYTEKLFKR
ncbi:MAG: capsular polysaccharide biosynthesis protein [Lachnospiraceae bacterium]|nr:capsular polysaccharide biosynthesis protein [Lachnospiraceae bacterium]